MVNQSVAGGKLSADSSTWNKEFVRKRGRDIALIDGLSPSHELYTCKLGL